MEINKQPTIPFFNLFNSLRGTCSDDVRAEQVAEVAASLNTDDVFVLETPAATYIWNGKVRDLRFDRQNRIDLFVLLGRLRRRERLRR